MAVVITSKFYQEDEWKDISKVVFTSPNLVSPSVAGTRSHILPGQGNLGMWYEDTSEMFRVEGYQRLTESDFYNIESYLLISIDLADDLEYIDVEDPNIEGLANYIRESSDVEPVGYKEVTQYVESRSVKLEYTLVDAGLSNILNGSNDPTYISDGINYGVCISIIGREVTDVVTMAQNPLGTAATNNPIYEYWQCSKSNVVKNPDGSYTNTPDRTAEVFTTVIEGNEIPTSGYFTKLDSGWFAPVIEDVEECHITFKFSTPRRITNLVMEAPTWQYGNLQSSLALNAGGSPEIYTSPEALGAAVATLGGVASRGSIWLPGNMETTNSLSPNGELGIKEVGPFIESEFCTVWGTGGGQTYQSHEQCVDGNAQYCIPQPVKALWDYANVNEIPESASLPEPYNTLNLPGNEDDFQIVRDYIVLTYYAGKTYQQALDYFNYVNDLYQFNVDDYYGTICEAYNKPFEEVEEEGKYFVGNFRIEASTDGSNFSTLATGSNTDNTLKQVFMSSNSSYYKYYRIVMLNNNSLDAGTFDKDYYGLKNVAFYEFDFADNTGTTPLPVYSFEDVEDPKIVKVTSASTLDGPLLHTDSSTTTINIEGTCDVETNIITVSGVITPSGIVTEGDLSTVSGTPTTVITDAWEEWGVSLHEVGNFADYRTSANPVSTEIGGQAVDTEAESYVSSDGFYMEVTALLDYVEAPNVATISGIEVVVSGTSGIRDIVFSSEGEYTVAVDTVQYSGRRDYKYSVSVSGTNTISGVYNTKLTGTFTREYDEYLSEKDAVTRMFVDSIDTPSGTLVSGTEMKIFGYFDRPLDLDTQNSVLFEVTTGEAYNCRLTAWDDVTHSTLLNELIYNHHARISAMAYCCGGNKLDPSESVEPISLVRPPVHNLIVKGNSVWQGQKLYYGDFDMVYRYQDGVVGDFLMFKPILYGIHPGISYGVHDYIVTLHYSYT